MELIVLNIPKDSLKVDQEHNNCGLYVRPDKTNLLDLNINTNTLMDRKSGINLSEYLLKKISYK